MDKWTTLEPVKLHSLTLPSITGGGGGASSSKNQVLARAASHQNRAQYIGRLPSDIHLLVLAHLAVPDIPSYARASRALGRLANDGGGDSKLWRARLAVLRRIGHGPSDCELLLGELERRHAARPGHGLGHKRRPTNASAASVDLSDFGGFVSSPAPTSLPPMPPPPPPEVVDDDFGDFASAPPLYTSPGPFSPLKTEAPSLVHHLPSATFATPPTPRDDFIRAHRLFRALLPHLAPATPPHQLLTRLLPPIALPPQPTKKTHRPAPSSSLLSIRGRPWPSETYLHALLLHALTLWLGDAVRGVRVDRALIPVQVLRGAVDRFETAMLTAFEKADADAERARDEWAMREAAWCAWEVWEGREGRDSVHSASHSASGRGEGEGGGWEVGRVWIERREVFYEGGRWDPTLNFTCVPSSSLSLLDSVFV
jgi:recyclin-1